MAQTKKLGIASAIYDEPDTPAGPSKPLGIAFSVPDDDPATWSTPKIPTLSRQPTVATPAPSWYERFSDLTLSGLKGAISLPEAAVGALDFATKVAPTPQNIVNRAMGAPPPPTLGGLLRDYVGFDPAAARQELDELYSPATKEAQRQLAESQGFKETVQTIAKNPSLAVQGTVEALPLMGAGGVVGRGLGALAKISGAVGGAVGEGVVTTASNVASVIQEKEAQGKTATATDMGLAAINGLITTGISMGSAQLAKRFGFADVDTMLAQSAKVPALSKTVKEYLGNTLKSVVTEAGLEELPQSFFDRVISNVQNGKPWDEGATKDAAVGAVLGAFMAGGASTVDFAGGLAERAAQRPARTPAKPADAGLPVSDATIARADAIEAAVADATIGGRAPALDLPIRPRVSPVGTVPNLPLNTDVQPLTPDLTLELVRRGFPPEDIATMGPDEARAIIADGLDAGTGAVAPPLPPELGPDAYAGPERRGPGRVSTPDEDALYAASRADRERAAAAFEQTSVAAQENRRLEAERLAADAGGVPPAAAGTVEVGTTTPVPEQTLSQPEPVPEPVGTVPEPRPPVPTFDETDATKYKKASIPGLYRGHTLTDPATGHAGVILDWYQGPDGSGRTAYKVKWDETGETTIVQGRPNFAISDDPRPGYEPPAPTEATNAAQEGTQPQSGVGEHQGAPEVGVSPETGDRDRPAPVGESPAPQVAKPAKKAGTKKGTETPATEPAPESEWMAKQRADAAERQRSYVERYGNLDLRSLPYDEIRRMDDEHITVEGAGSWQLEGEAKKLSNRIRQERWAREDAAREKDKPRFRALENDHDKTAYRSFHSVQGSNLRWERARASGMSDDALMAAIGDEFGLGGGGSGYGKYMHDHKGGKNPSLKVYSYSDSADIPAEEHVYKGKKLIELARRVLGIPEVDEGRDYSDAKVDNPPEKVDKPTQAAPTKPFAEMTREEKLAAIAAKVAAKRGEAAPAPETKREAPKAPARKAPGKKKATAAPAAKPTPKPAEPERPKAVPAWRRTQDEYFAAFESGDPTIRVVTTDGRLITPQSTGPRWHVDAQHERLVKEALVAGLPVPDAVIEPYDELLRLSKKLEQQRGARAAADPYIDDEPAIVYRYLMDAKAGNRSAWEDLALDSGVRFEAPGKYWDDANEASLLEVLFLQVFAHPSFMDTIDLPTLRGHLESAEEMLARDPDEKGNSFLENVDLENLRELVQVLHYTVLRREGQQGFDFDLRVDPVLEPQAPEPPVDKEQAALDARRAASKAKREEALKKLNKNLGYTASTGIDPENIGLVLDIIESYIEDGVTELRQLVLDFRRQYGRREDLDDYFDAAWELQTGEKADVASIKDEDAAPLTASARLYTELRTKELPKDNREVKALITRIFPDADPNSNEMLNAATDAIEAVLASRLGSAVSIRRPIDVFEKPEDVAAAVEEAFNQPSLYDDARTLEKQLTRAYRTPEKMRLQQFSTPLPISVAVAFAAQTRAADRILEPTAGTGNLVAPLKGSAVTVSELDPSRAALLQAQGWKDVRTLDYLRSPVEKNAWDVIVSNPPWGSYKTGKYGNPIAGEFKPGDVAERFVAKMVKELKPGGRLVAVMPTTMLGASGVNFRNYLDKQGTIRAIIKSPPKAYDTRGTSVESILLVWDKHPGASGKAGEGARVESLNTADWAEYQAAVERIGSRAQVTETQEPAPKPQTAGGKAGGRTAGTSAGRPGRRPGTAPGGTRNAPGKESGDGAPPVVPDVQPGERKGLDESRGGESVSAGQDSVDPTRGLSDDQLVAYRAAERSDRFAPYQLRTTLHGVRHPRVMVEARGLAGVPYPPIEYVPTQRFTDIISEGRASIEQAEQALAAIQANRGEKGHGYLAADNVGVGKAREAWLVVIEAMERAKMAGHPMRLILTTKNADNIANLISGELPALLGDQPPGFEIISVADYKDARRTAGNQGQELASLPKPAHAVYVVDSYNLAPFREALVEANVNGIVGDEAHRFKNAEAQVGAAWQQLHADVFSRVPREQQLFAYFTATPAQAVEDYQYLYGLRMWPIDGFGDWIDMVTGQASEDDAKKIREAAEAGGYDVGAVAGNNSDEVVGTDSEDVPTRERPQGGQFGGRSDVFTSRLTPAEGEQITREWKRLGRFSSRDLWREGTEFVVHTATPEQADIDRYDQFTELARSIIAAATKFGRANKANRSGIGGVKSQLQFAAKRVQMQPSLVEAVRLAKEQLAAGHQVVLSMINVSEFDAEAGNIAAAIRGINIHDIDVTKDGQVIDNGEIPEALQARAELMEQAAAMDKLPSPVTFLEEELGASNIAFIIGGNVKNRETHAREFQEGVRKVAVISAAGSTGISLDHRVKTEGGAQGRRVFIDVQFDWSATEAIQRYGRVDRASQISPPKIMALNFGTAAEKKFLGTIANKLASLGALSKGGSETTGTDLEEFEINGAESTAAAREAWNSLPDSIKEYFTGRLFKEAVSVGGGNFVEYPAKRTQASIKDILLAMLFVPTEHANAYWEKFLAERARLMAMNQEGAERRTKAGRGEILRSLVLTPELTLHQVRDANGGKFGILSGVIMPEMPRIRDFLRDMNGDVRRHYTRLTTGEQQTVAGLEVAWGRIPGLAKFYGRALKAEVLDTPEKVLEALRAGDTVDLEQKDANGKPWKLRMRRDGKVSVDGVKMADRQLVMKHGIGYQAAGNWWEATNLALVLDRFPVAKPKVEATKEELEHDEDDDGTSNMATPGGGRAENMGPSSTMKRQVGVRNDKPAPPPPSSISALGAGIDRIRALEFPELLELARALIGDVDAVKGFRKLGSLGQFRQSMAGASIRLHSILFKTGNEQSLAAAIAHEIGHAIDYLPHRHLKRGNLLGRLYALTKFMKGTFTDPNGTEVSNKEIREELLAVTRAWSPYDRDKVSKGYLQYRESAKELYADAISALLTNPAFLREKAPKFFDQFFVALDAAKPEVQDAYFGLLEVVSGTRAEMIDRRIESHRAMFARGDVRSREVQELLEKERKEADGSLWMRFKINLIDRNMAVIDKVKAVIASGKPVNPDDDPRYLLEERNYLGGKIKGWMERTIQPIYKDLAAAKVSWTDFGLAMMYERITAGDRSEIANPKGLSPDSAQEAYDRLIDGLLPEQRTVLSDALLRYREAFAEVTDAAYESGLYTDAQKKNIDENPAYGTFQVIDYIADGLSSSIIRQAGTLLDIANVADATLLKAMVTIRATEHNNVKRSVFDFWDEHYPDEIEQAREVGWGRNRQVLEPPRGKRSRSVLVTYKEKGVLRGKYVDPFVAASLNNESVGRNGAVVSLLRLMNSKVFRPLFTTYNPGFMSFNVARDFLRFWKAIPTMNMRRALKRYAQAVPMARVRAFGLPENPTPKQLEAWNEMIAAEEAKIFSITFNDMAQGREVEDSQIEDIFVRSGIGNVKLKRHPLVRALRAVLDPIEKVGNFIETLPKAAAIHEFKGEGSIADLTAAQRSRIRKEVGSPDFLAGGSWKPIFNEVFLFSNAITQALRADVSVATRPETRGGFWFKTAALNILPKVVAFGLLAGMGGGSKEDKERKKRLWGNISEYDFTNYQPFPIGTDERGRTVYLRLPQDDIGRLIGGLVWKALGLARGDRDTMTGVMQVMSYTAGEAPALTPSITAPVNVLDFLSGINLMDRFRGQPLFTDDEFKAKDSRMVRKFVGWQFQQVGGSVFWKFVPGEVLPRTESPGQKLLNFPVVSNVAGRWLKISNYGEVESLRNIRGAVEREEARARLDQKEEINAVVRQWRSLQPWEQTTEWRRNKAREIVNAVYADASKLEKAEKAHRLEKTLKIALKRGEADPFVDQLLSATSNKQKAAILEAAKVSKGDADYQEWFADLRREKLISDELSKLVR